ncbi:MAG: hypothetical protein H0T73_23900 [Ardenticatenales bacterium]|nr:hypothetical protein [Ardenticatenales bacterium]
MASILVFMAGTQLYVLTEYTDRFFSWTINPPLTAAFLGASYWASFLLEFLASRKRTWAESRIAVAPVLTFTTLTLIVTLLHLDKFHLDTSAHEPITIFATWAWIIVYAVVPPLMFAVLLFQTRLPGADVPRGEPLPIWMRGLLGFHGTVMVLLGLAFFVAPTAVAPIWPWTLTALTGRAVGAWLLGLGIAALQVVWENDWARVQIALVSYLGLGVLHLIAMMRYLGLFNWSQARSWLYLIFILSIFAVGLYGTLRARQVVPTALPEAS